MARVRKMVVSRVRSVKEVRAALAVFKAKGAAGFGSAFEPILEGRPRPDILPILELTDELLDHARETLETSEKALQRSTSEDAGLNKAQEDVVRRLGAKILRLRNLCLGHFDPATVARVGLDVGISRQPDSLLHQADLIHDHLSAPNLTFPQSALGEQAVDPASLAAFLEPERAELAEAVRTLRTERKRDAMAVIEKQAMMDNQEQVFRRVVRFLKAVFRLAGEDELASRLVPVLRRIRTSDEEEEEEEEETGDEESPAADPPAPGSQSPEAGEPAP